MSETNPLSLVTTNMSRTTNPCILLMQIIMIIRNAQMQKIIIIATLDALKRENIAFRIRTNDHINYL